MFLLSVLLSQAVHASAFPCTMEQTLQNPKSECVSQLTKKIKNEQDRSEFKFRLSQWKKPAGLNVFTDSGFIEAQMNGKPLVRALWFKYGNPAVLWYNGKVLTEASKNPSLARTLDKLFKPNAKAFRFVPEAHAEDADLVKNVMFFYSIENKERVDALTDSKPANAVVKSKKNMGDYLPYVNPFIRFFGGADIKCTGRNTVEPMLVELNPGESEMQVMIKQKSPTEFILSGIEKDKTHLITVTSFSMKLGEQSRQIISPTWSFDSATVAECLDVNCEKVGPAYPYLERELIFGRAPEEEKRAHEVRSKVERDEVTVANQHRRKMLAARMFGMSVMGNICEDPVARDELKANHSLNLVPAATPATTTR